MSKQLMRLTSLMLMLVIMLSGCGHAVKAPVQEEKGTMFMWEVKAKEGSGKIYLLGSIHAGKEGLYPLNETIMKAYEQSQVLAVECDTSTLLQRSNLAELMQKIMYSDGTTLKDHISEDLYSKTEKALQNYGMTIQMVEKMKPFMIASALLAYKMKEWGYDAENGIDMYFLNKAHEENKEIVEIESLEFQYDLLGSFSDEIQELELKSALEGVESTKNYLDEMFAAWQTGDTEGLEKLMTEEDKTLSDKEKEIYKAYEKAMFDDRNAAMANKAEEYLKTGKTYFYIVGSGHMIGDSGIVKILKDKGYKVIQK